MKATQVISRGFLMKSSRARLSEDIQHPDNTTNRARYRMFGCLEPEAHMDTKKASIESQHDGHHGKEEANTALLEDIQDMGGDAAYPDSVDYP